jgi:hypothetical protein
MMGRKYHLYFDDSGSRDPDKADLVEGKVRQDRMDCFALGGILVREEDIDQIFTSHKAFCRKHDITYPLHSWAIRGGRGKFAWLKTPEKAGNFYAVLEEYLLSLPIIALACVVNRPGYVARYKERYNQRLWLMCKTAFSILAERAAKLANDEGRQLEIYFEGAGPKEDGDILQYMRALKTEGSPFSDKTSEGYAPLSKEDYRRIILGEPRQRTKKTPMIQIADLVLFPMAKAGYDPQYRPYAKLAEAGKLIDCRFEVEDRPFRGIKYSCFDP